MNKFALIIPMFNEERIITQTLTALDGFLRRNYPQGDYLIVAVDNASTDGTGDVISSLLPAVGNLRYLRLPEKGKGRAIRAGWEYALGEPVETFVFMDADLSVDISGLTKMIEASQTCDVCIGDRYHPESVTIRPFKRKIFSRAYRGLARWTLDSDISDFPCGFKAVSRRVVRDIVPRVKNQTWFFDTELVVLSEKAGMKITHIPVRSEDIRSRNNESKVNVWHVTRQYLEELLRLRKRLREEAVK